MKRLGPILVILFGAVLTFGGLSTTPTNAGINVPTCDTLAPTAIENVVTTTLPPCRPCDTIPMIGSLVPCETTTTEAATTTTVAATVAPTTTAFSGSGANLPATGSTGVSVTLVMGIVLMSLGVILLLVRRRSPSAPAS